MADNSQYPEDNAQQSKRPYTSWDFRGTTYTPEQVGSMVSQVYGDPSAIAEGAVKLGANASEVGSFLKAAGYTGNAVEDTNKWVRESPDYAFDSSGVLTRTPEVPTKPSYLQSTPPTGTLSERSYSGLPPVQSGTSAYVSPEGAVSYQLNQLLSSGSPLLETAKQRALETANRQGLLSSSMATGAATKAMIDEARAIAEKDAARYSTRDLSQQGFEQNLNTIGYQGNISAGLQEMQDRAAMDRLVQQGLQNWDIETLQQQGRINLQNIQDIAQLNRLNAESVNTIYRDTLLNDSEFKKLDVQIAADMDTATYAQLAELMNDTRVMIDTVRNTPDSQMSPAEKEKTYKEISDMANANAKLIMQFYNRKDITFNFENLVPEPLPPQAVSTTPVENQINNSILGNNQIETG